MNQNIIIRKSDYLEITEDLHRSGLEISYEHTSMGTYEPWKQYLIIRIGDYDGFKLYVEIDKYNMQKIITSLQKQLNNMW